MKNKHKKDVLFLCQYFYPETNSSATLPFDTASALAAHGFEVGTLCGYPKEYSNEKCVPKDEEIQGVEIHRLRYLQLKRTGVLGRLVNFLSFMMAVFLNVYRLRQFKSVVVYSNPPMLPLIAVIGKKLYGTKIVFVAYDIYPEIAIVTENASSSGWMSKLMRWVNRLLYKNADAVVALTEEMKEYLSTNRNIPEEKIKVISNWANEETFLERTINKRDYDNPSFVVSYFGNMGICQDMDTLVSAAESMKDDKNVKFMLVGHGCKKEGIKERTREKGLTNMTVADYLCGEELEKALSDSDICVVSLERGLNGLCAPSKYYSYLLAGKAVISITDSDSYLFKEITEKKNGVSVSNGDVEALVTTIRMCATQRESVHEMGLRSYEMYRDCYSKDIGTNKYIKLCSELNL